MKLVGELTLTGMVFLPRMNITGATKTITDQDGMTGLGVSIVTKVK